MKFVDYLESDEGLRRKVVTMKKDKMNKPSWTLKPFFYEMFNMDGKTEQCWHYMYSTAPAP